MGELSALEERVVRAVDMEALVTFLGELIAIPSVANEETPAQERMAAEMRAVGLDTDVWEIDFARLKQHPAYSADVDRHRGLGVVGTTPRTTGDGRTLILNGHIDVVPAGVLDRWTHPPFELTADTSRLYGRGTADMKGALCCALSAARAIHDAGVRLAGALQIQSVIGEEDGGSGTLATIQRGHAGDGAIVLEPTGFVVAPAQAGALSFRITVPGLAAHGAFREEGVDPVEKFIPIFQRLRALEAARNEAVADPLFHADALPFALTMGRLAAGIWPSTVAERLVVEGRYGIAPDEDVAEARAAFEASVAAVVTEDRWLAEHPPVVEWRGAQFEAARTKVGDPVVTVLSDAVASVLPHTPTLGGMRFGSDMRLLVHQGGIPTVLFGPGDVREAHRPNESVFLDELIKATKILAVTALRFCGVAR